jgi:hypothetical protein
MTNTVLVEDRHLPRDEPSPYRLLSERLVAAGFPPLGPNATAADVNDVLFDLMQAGGVGVVDRAAWDALRRLPERLVQDFLMYAVPPNDVATAAARIASIAIPVAAPEWRGLAAVPPDLSRISLPSAPARGADPGPPPIERVVLDIGPLQVNVFAVLE